MFGAEMASRFDWTTQSDNSLIKHYHTMSAEELAILLGVSKSAILRRARVLGIPKKSEESYSSKSYTQAEVLFILEKVNKIGVTAVANALKRSEEAIRIFCKRRKIKICFTPSWTAKQTKLLRTHGHMLNIEELSLKLGKSPQAIRKYANENSIPLAKNVQAGKSGPWTETEKVYLASNLHRLKHHEIAKHLGRTAEAVARYASSHGLTKTKQHVSINI